MNSENSFSKQPCYVFKGPNGPKDAVAYLRALNLPPTHYDQRGVVFVSPDSGQYIAELSEYNNEWTRKNRFFWLGIGGVIATIFIAVKNL